MAMGYAVITSSGSCVLTASYSSSVNSALVVHEVSGVDTSNPFDASSVQHQDVPTASNGAVTSGTIATSQNNAYIFAVVADAGSNSATYTAGSGYTPRQTLTGWFQTADKVQTSAGTASAVFTSSLGYDHPTTGVMSLRPSQSQTPSDTIAPTTPTGLSASAVSTSAINLSWSPSTDNTAVTGYKIYRGGVQIGTATTNSYSDTGLSANTTYSYTVSAYDGAGNNSTQSTAVSATTQAVLPVISNLVGSNITTSAITISWDTNVPTNGQVFYGLTTSYGSQSSLLDNTTKTTTHSTTLSGLTPNTTYNFKVTSVDALGNTTSSTNFSFTTQSATPVDTTAPTISAITKSGITTSGATISWTTNENSDTQVEYGLTTAYGSQTTLNTTLLTNHSVALSGLTASTTYNFRVKSKDSAGNLAVSSNQTLTTLPLPDTTAPTISNVVISSITANSATVTWTTNENSDTQVDYGTTASYGLQTTRNTTLTTTHSASITNLSSGVTYNLRVRSTDASGNLATSVNYTFTTTTPAPPQDTTAPVISAITTSNLTPSSVQIGWNTDESASGYVAYGTTASYGLTSPVDSTLKTSRTIALSTLKRNTTYNYQVVSTDASGNIGRSTNRTFTTPSRLSKPPKTSTLTAINGSVILTWSDPVDDNNDIYELWRGVLIMRSTAGFIQVPDKATALADVPSTTKTYRDTTVTAGTTYYYSVFTYDDQGVFSDPAYVSFTPTEQTQASTGGGATGGGSAGGSSSTSGTPSGSTGGGAPSTPTIVVFIPKSSPLASTTPTVIQTPNLTIVLITKTMSRGSKIAEVKILQQFLISQGYLPANTPLGYFGVLTEQAVKAFQKKQGIVSSGSPATTGYGMVGAKTRAVINALLQKQTSTSTQTSTTTETPEQTLARLQALLKQLQQMQGQR
jgi:chitodextrinase